MSESARTTELLEALAKVLARCTAFGFLLLMLSFGFYMVGADLAYEVNGKMFGLSQHELALFFYGWLGFMKLVWMVFFLFPWLAIKLVLLKEHPTS